MLQICCYNFFALSQNLKPRIKVSACWWSGNKKYFYFLFTVNRALLQSHANPQKLFWRNFLTCCSCSYYKFRNSLNNCAIVRMFYWENVWKVVQNSHENTCNGVLFLIFLMIWVSTLGVFWWVLQIFLK